jgi:heptosyltransferase-3
LCRIAGAKLNVGYLKPGKKPGPYQRFARYIDKKNGYDPHFLEHYLELLKPIAVPPREPVPRLEASAEVKPVVLERLRTLGMRPGEFVAIHFGARLERRVWRMEKVARLALGLVRDGVPVLLLYGPGEEKLAGELRQSFTELGATPPFWEGPADFEVLLAVAAFSRVFVGNDSGPMHVAAASGTRVVGLFGRTEPSRWGPRGTGAMETVQAPMPCECAFVDVCQPEKAETACVWKVEVEPVRAAVDKLMKMR